MPRFKLTIAYDGTGLVGWQRQAHGVSVQGLLEDALAALDGRPVAVAGAGRTDAGVHARAQVAALTLVRDVDPTTLLRVLNARLPPAVRVLEVSAAPAVFHPRFDARAKTYEYRIWNDEVLSPFERSHAWHLPVRLDAAAMAQAAAYVAGRHDFAAFKGSGGEPRSTVREVFSSEIRVAPPLVLYQVRGDGFLRHMVRNIVGSLVEVGRGRYDPSWIAQVIESRDRSLGGRTAPPEGLFLVAVEYEGPVYNRDLPEQAPHVA